jgi:hypothetical protein
MAIPDLAAVKTYLGDTSFEDATISAALAAETASQANYCTIPAVYPVDLGEALLRRVARNLAMRGIPLAVLQGDSDLGSSTFLPGKDPLVRMYEAPYRRLVVG